MISEGDGSMQRAIDAGLCPRCHSSGRVEVHGHVQCSVCKMYVDECCSGETASCATPVVSSHEKHNEGDKSPETNEQKYAPYDNL